MTPIIRIDGPFLNRHGRGEPDALTPSDALTLAARFGDLAPWWLHDAVLERAAAAAPGHSIRPEWFVARHELPEDEGACWVVLHGKAPRLKPAFPLLLQWVADRTDGPNLPAALRGVAKSVRDALAGDEAVRKRGRWGLHLHPRLGGDQVFDLRGLSFGFESGWAPLAAGLILRAEGACPDRRVWASARQGEARVEGLADKAAAARRWGATTFFVPPGQAAETRADGLEVVELGRDADPRAALREYLLRVDRDLAAPGDESPAALRQRKRRHLRRLRADPAAARTYYRDHLLPSIVCRGRAWLDSLDWPDRPPFLVTIASDNPEVAALTAAVLRPRRCLILYTPDKTGALNLATSLLKRHAPDVEHTAREFANDAAMGRAIHGRVEEVFGRPEPCQLAFDLTPGDKLMSLSLAYPASPFGSWQVYLRHDYYDPQTGVRGVEPFTERFLIWPAGKTWAEALEGATPEPVTIDG